MQSAFDDETVVLGGELGVGVAGHVGGEPDVASESGVSLFGDPGAGFGLAGLVDSSTSTAAAGSAAQPRF
jgi:hypothetical protein